MCSVNDCEFDSFTTIPSENESNLTNVKCKKCLENEAQILLRGKDAYCQNCFLIAATHKFRASLGKSKIVRPNDQVLVAHSGKAGSTALLHLIRAGMHESVHKRLIFKTTVLYIDENLIYGSSLEERVSILKKINEQTKSLGFDGHFVTISQIFDATELQLQPLDCQKIPTKLDESLLKCFNSISEMTSKEDFLTKIRQKLIVAAAKKLNCNKIFLGDDMASLSIKILENVALGRAAHLPLDVNFVDNRYPNILLLRPMKDFSKKELHYYINHFKLEIIHIDNLTTKKDSSVSIRKLTEKFVNDLDAGTNSTVSTIFRTAEKLNSESGKKENLRDKDVCILCEAYLDTDTENQEICTLEATTFSRMVSRKGLNFEKENVKVGENCGTECAGCCSETKKRSDLVHENVLQHFCYGCRLIVKNFKTMGDVPDFLYTKIVKQMSLENMRSEIEEFLL